MSDIVYSGLTVDVRKREGQEVYEFGVWLDGAFVVIGGRKTGGVDDDIARAKDAAERAAASPASPAAPAG